MKDKSSSGNPGTEMAENESDRRWVDPPRNFTGLGRIGSEVPVYSSFRSVNNGNGASNAAKTSARSDGKGTLSLI